MFAWLDATAVGAAGLPAPLQQLGPELFAGPLGTLLVALVVIAVVVFVGRYVMSVAWRLIKIAIVIVAVVWLASVVLPQLGVL